MKFYQNIRNKKLLELEKRNNLITFYGIFYVQLTEKWKKEQENVWNGNQEDENLTRICEKMRETNRT